MKAIVCQSPGKLVLTDCPEPERGQGEVLVQVRRVGICGTDFGIFTGRHPYLDYPRVIGHELSGVVCDAAAGSRFGLGELVVVNPYLACGTCVACALGKPNCCKNIKVLGVHADGAMCEFVAVPESALLPGAGLSEDQAAMVEFLSIGLHAVRRSRLREGAQVLVVGFGPIGAGVALFAKQAGAHVTIADINAARVERGRTRFGFDDAIVAGSDMAAALSEITKGDFYDVVFDVTGNVSAMEAGFGYVAHGGTYVLVSIVNESVTFFDPEFHKREMALLGSRNAVRDDFADVIEGIRSGAIDTELFHTHQCDLGEVPEKLPLWASAQDEVVKAITRVS